MRAINVWAWQEQLISPGSFQRTPICSNASDAARAFGNSGRWLAAGGWHMAFSFSTLADLASKLRETELPESIPGEQRRLQRGEVQTLAIDCHGSDGIIYPEGIPGPAIGAPQLRRYGEELTAIGLMTASREHVGDVPNPPHRLPRRVDDLPASTILLMSCNTGAGPRGTELLRQLSYRWPNRHVVGFSTTVIIPNLHSVTDPASGEQCVPPLVVDSGQHGMRRAEADAWMTQFRETLRTQPSQIPYADADAANAKIAVNGRIERWPSNEPQRGASLDPQLVGPPRGNTLRPSLNRQSSRALA